jgi:peptidoglycan/xylan/chitin deacetylase (PgdA/CDA1 family)
MKNKLFPLISILVLAILFGIAATCNMCGLNPSTPTALTETTTGSETIAEKSEGTTTVTGEGTTTVVTKEETTADVSTVIEAGIVNHATKQIALTFDAGWLYENTEALLNLLDKYNVKATFFVRGLWAKEHPNLATEIVNRGHDLENHSLTHGHMNTMTDAEVQNEIHKTTDIIRETTGYLPNLFRPPYGEYDKRILKILKEEGYPYTILWTVDSYDWAEEMNGIKITKDYLISRVLDKASDNGIILMHVGGYETIGALPEIITGLRSEGYELVKVNDML